MHTCQYLDYSWGDFKVFSLQGQHVVPTGAKYSVMVNSSAPNFTPIGTEVEVLDRKTENFTNI